MIGFNNILHNAWLQTKDFSCKNQESCSMVGIVESGLRWPHHSVERRLCLVWPHRSVCRGAKPRHGEAECGGWGRSLTWPCYGGWILHPGVCNPPQGWSDSPQRWLIPSRGCWEDRISLACPQKKWPSECWSTPVPSPETGHLVGWEKLGLLVWK